MSRQDFVEHGGRVISAAKQPEILHVPLVATNDLLSESPNSIFGTSFFLRETMNKTCIDHIYTNMDEDKIKATVWETYFSDHKAVYALINGF